MTTSVLSALHIVTYLISTTLEGQYYDVFILQMTKLSWEDKETDPVGDLIQGTKYQGWKNQKTKQMVRPPKY